MSDTAPITPAELRALQAIERRVAHLEFVARAVRQAATWLPAADRLAIEGRLRDIAANGTPGEQGAGVT